MTKQYKSFTLPLASCTNPKDYKTLQTVWTKLKDIWVNQVWPEHTLMTQAGLQAQVHGAWMQWSSLESGGAENDSQRGLLLR